MSFLPSLPASVRTASAESFVPVALPVSHPFAADPATVVDGRYTMAELDTAFRAIQDPGNWKLPIRCGIPAAMLPVASAACVWFAGSRLTVEAATADRWAIVTAPGYYATIGA